jgi:hypothetical protein
MTTAKEMKRRRKKLIKIKIYFIRNRCRGRISDKKSAAFALERERCEFFAGAFCVCSIIVAIQMNGVYEQMNVVDIFLSLAIAVLWRKRSVSV